MVFIAATYVGYLFMGYAVDRANFLEVLLGYSFLFAATVVFYKHCKEFTWRDLLLVAMLFRAAFLFSEPRLSDDYYRFIWDGRLVAAGENPYLILPNDFAETERSEELGINGEIFEGMNSKQYYTVYPPLNQALFAFSSLMGFGDPLAELFFLHLMILFSDLLFLSIMAKLLRMFSIPHTAAIGYALNPLVIIELSGNLHFEGVVLTFLALAVWLYLQKEKWWWISAVCFGAAISVKLLPLMLLPLVAVVLKWKAIRYYAVVGITFLVGFLPFYSFELLVHWQSSIALYFKSFEFNASIYYVLRSIGSNLIGYNPIQTVGPALSLIALSAILVVAYLQFRKKATSINGRFLQVAQSVKLTYLVYFLMATTVHPWYIITLAAISIFTTRKGTLLWSFLVVLSYSHYDGGGFQENYMFIALEYTILAIVILIPTASLMKWQSKVLNESL
ncbi:MAG: hypothetical protein ACJAU0_001471 [Flavobacteriales bacterium]